MRSTVVSLFLAVAMLPGCNPATGDGTPPPPNGSAATTNRVSPPPTEAGAPNSPVDPQDDALVPDTAFDAMGQVRCVTPGRRSARDCTAGVIRSRDGSATVTIFSPEGRSRAIRFASSGAAIGADTAEADGSARQPFAARHSGARTIITLGPERYEIADSLVSGR